MDLELNSITSTPMIMKSTSNNMIDENIPSPSTSSLDSELNSIMSTPMIMKITSDNMTDENIPSPSTSSLQSEQTDNINLHNGYIDFDDKTSTNSPMSDATVSDIGDVSVSKYVTEEIKKEEAKLRRKLYAQERLERKKRLQEEEEKQKREMAIKAMNYLLNKSQAYSEFLTKKLNLDNKENNQLNSNEQNELMKNIKTAPENRKTKKGKSKQKPETDDICETPKYFEGGTLRPYQLEGLTWLKALFENGVNGILADEMGLGKTIQVIALICFLMEKGITGPFLILAPLSTITNWASEFERFAPKIPVVILHGSKSTREQVKKQILSGDFYLEKKKVKPVVITTYLIPLMEPAFLGKFTWSYLILDEAQNIKNHLSKRHIIISQLRSSNRLLLTGTPLQNDMIELWSLLNFLMPALFGNSETFTSLFNLEDFKNANKMVETEKETKIIQTLRGVIAPFILRRLKKDVLHDMVPKKEVLVYCPLTHLQKTLYKYILDRNIDALMGREEENEIDVNAPRPKRKCTMNKKYTESSTEDIADDDEFMDILIREINEHAGKPTEVVDKNLRRCIRNSTMVSPFMALRKVVNHPYLIHMPYVETNKGVKEFIPDQDIINTSGKMVVLDAMLPELKKRGHKVLIFSFFVIMLDLIEEYLIYRDYKYTKLTGSMDFKVRDENIKDFKTDPDTFVFLITTKAGGLGLNLSEADTVILFDSDWNPQTDLQAQDRCHRIGQKKPVVVYRFICKNTIDEKILTKSEIKRKLEKAIIKSENLKRKKNEDIALLKELAELINSAEHDLVVNGNVFTKQELTSLLDRSDLYKQMEERQNDSTKE